VPAICQQLNVTVGQLPEDELSLYAAKLHELPLDATLEAAVSAEAGGQADQACHAPPTAADAGSGREVLLHLLPYKALWEDYWRAAGGVATATRRRRCGDPRCPHCGPESLPGEPAAGCATPDAPSPSSANPKPDWLPLYWHLWLSDPEHTTGYTVSPPDGCPPVSFLADADTPLRVTLDVFLGWMGIGSEAYGTADAKAGVAAPAPAEPDIGSTAAAAAAPLDRAPTARQRGTVSQGSEPPTASKSVQEGKPDRVSGAGGGGSWSRRMDWLRGGGNRVLRLLGAGGPPASTPGAAAASAASQGESGRDGGDSGGAPRAPGSDSGSDAGHCCYGNGSGGGSDSSDTHTHTHSARGSYESAQSVLASPAMHAARASAVAAAAAPVIPTLASAAAAAAPAAAAAAPAPAAPPPAAPLQLLWLNRAVDYDASPAELGMCDQSVVALLNLCPRSDCAACLMTRGALHGAPHHVRAALAVGGLGALEEAPAAAAPHALQQAQQPQAGGSGGAAAGDGGGGGQRSRPPMLLPLGMAAANGHEEVLRVRRLLKQIIVIYMYICYDK
jgi:hypothetical protein